MGKGCFPGRVLPGAGGCGSTSGETNRLASGSWLRLADRSRLPRQPGPQRAPRACFLSQEQGETLCPPRGSDTTHQHLCVEHQLRLSELSSLRVRGGVSPEQIKGLPPLPGHSRGLAGAGLLRSHQLRVLSAHLDARGRVWNARLTTSTGKGMGAWGRGSAWPPRCGEHGRGGPGKGLPRSGGWHQPGSVFTGGGGFQGRCDCRARGSPGAGRTTWRAWGLDSGAGPSQRLLGGLALPHTPS